MQGPIKTGTEMTCIRLDGPVWTPPEEVLLKEADSLNIRSFTQHVKVDL